MKVSLGKSEMEAMNYSGFAKNMVYDYFDGEDYVSLDVISVDEDKKTVLIAVTNRGKISVIEYDVMLDDYDSYIYFGSPEVKIYSEEFEEVA